MILECSVVICLCLWQVGFATLCLNKWKICIKFLCLYGVLILLPNLCSAKQEKYDVAMQHGDSVKVVTPDWVTDSVTNKQLMEEIIYHPKLITPPKPETPPRPELPPITEVPMQVSWCVRELFGNCVSVCYCRLSALVNLWIKVFTSSERNIYVSVTADCPHRWTYEWKCSRQVQETQGSLPGWNILVLFNFSVSQPIQL